MEHTVETYIEGRTIERKRKQAELIVEAMTKLQEVGEMLDNAGLMGDHEEWFVNADSAMGKIYNSSKNEFAEGHTLLVQNEGFGSIEDFLARMTEAFSEAGNA